MAPARDSAEDARAKARDTVSSKPSSITVCGTASRRPATGRAGGSSGGMPAITASAMAQQATLLASGPIELSVVESGSAPASGTRCCVGLKPTTPQSAAGTRTEPPVSVPIATTQLPSFAATPAPEDEPPGMRARSAGLPGVP